MTAGSPRRRPNDDWTGSAPARSEGGGDSSACVRIAISSCLAGEPVRYDGRDKKAPVLLEALAGDVEWVPICPEVGVGMGVPREPVRLEWQATSSSSQPRLVGVRSGRDWTDEMDRFAADQAAALRRAGVSGWVFKSRSPSCGVRGVDVFKACGEEPEWIVSGQIAGLFAANVRRLWPELPVVDEDEVKTESAARAFLTQVRAYHSRKTPT